MSFAQRSSSRRPSTDTVVYGVGQRVYVSRSGATSHVDLMNDDGTAAVAKLLDGAEVMVVAWKPRGATGTRYCVRCTSDGREGWLAAANLRRALTGPSTAAASTPPTKTVVASPLGAGRNAKPRFGAR
jgi:hypothetical protein